MNQAIKLEFEERKLIFEKYKAIIEEHILSNPNDVEAVSLVAMILLELRFDKESAFAYLENCYSRFAHQLLDDDFSLLVTNMAYFYFEEYCNCDKAIEMLHCAIDRNSKYVNTYYALGLALYSKKEYDDASKQFEKAYKLTNDKRYLHCQAVCAFYMDNMKRGIELLRGVTIDYSSEYDIRTGLMLANFLALDGKTILAKKIAKHMLEIDSENMNYFEVADIMFLIGEYSACAELYEKEKLYEDSSWLGIYFYALQQSGQSEKAYKKISQLRNDINKEVNTEQTTPQDWNDEEELNEYINQQKERLLKIEKCFYTVFELKEKPLYDYHPDILYWCYYINCPRHSIG